MKILHKDKRTKTISYSQLNLNLVSKLIKKATKNNNYKHENKQFVIISEIVWDPKTITAKDKC